MPGEPRKDPVLALAQAMHDAELCQNWSPGYGYLDAEGNLRDDHGAAEHYHEARRVLAVLPAAPASSAGLDGLRAALNDAARELHRWHTAHRSDRLTFEQCASPYCFDARAALATSTEEPKE